MRELVIDFETATGIDLPLKPGTSPTLNAKGKSFLVAMKDVERIADPNPIFMGRWLKAKSLQPLVGNSVYHGLSRRPVFVGGQATYQTIRRMTENQRFVDRAGVTAVAEWGHAVIAHDPTARQLRAQVFIEWAQQRQQHLGRQRAVPQ